MGASFAVSGLQRNSLLRLYSLHACRADNGDRPAAPRSAPTVSNQETDSRGHHPPSHEVHVNGNERPASTSLDRLLEELNTVNVANSSGQDEHTAIEKDNVLLNTSDVDAEKEKPSLDCVQEGRTCLPDLNKFKIPGVEIHVTAEVSSSRTKKLRRIRQDSHMKQKLESEITITGDLLENHRSLNYQSTVKIETHKAEEKATISSYDLEYKPEETSLQFGHGEIESQELPVSKDGNRPPLVRRIGRVEKILSVKNRDAGSDAIFRVKENLRSYRQVVFVQGSVLQKHCPQLLRSFLKRMDHLGRRDGHTLEDTETPDFDPVYTRIDRIIAAEQRGSKKCYLVKWCGLPYTEATWEREENLRRDVGAICRFHKNNLRISAIRRAETSSQGEFKDGRRLRDYQEAGVAWLDHNFKNRTNCILADEMGLGKTIQSVAMLENLRTKRRIRGPFLVVAPVSTLGHWQREIESLTDMNCVVYTGNQEDRQIIRNHEFYYADGNSCELKFNVLLTSFEILMKDQNKLARETWQYIIVDEAHRLKSRDSKTAQSLRQLHVRHGGLLLLTGTPVQNNTKEIFSLLNLLDQNEFDSEEDFLRKYGDIKAAEQTIVWVELTKEQRTFYRAIYENNIATLLKGSTANNMPNLRNVAMELRKLCNHPFLCDGLEESILSKHRSANDGSASNLAETLLSQSSGKMVLVDKLLPKLKEAGRRVLIFSQFTMMLDLLEDYLLAKGYSYERIDGKIRGSDRQAAIDRYSAKNSSIFVFLLSTRAGGLGITLTAADTCIIYDSDWNPQNDLQAMARCHRIGQTKDVKIYRLITRNTYEQRLFECSSRKYGLDEAILGNRMGVDVTQDHIKNIESLLKHGAYDMLKDDGEAASEFSSQNIEQILEQRTQQRQIGGRTNNTFSVATFISNPELASEANAHDAEYGATASWQELLPEACEKAVLEAMASKAPPLPFLGGLRKRTRSGVDYKDMDVSLENSSDETDALRKMRKGTRARVGRGVPTIDEDPLGLDTDIKQWSDRELKRLEDQLFALGRGRTEQIMIEARLSHHGAEEVEEVSEALIQLCQYMQVCNELGTFQSDSPAGDVTLPGNATTTNARSDRRRSTSATPLPTIHEQGITKLEAITKVETRSKRNSGIRVLTNSSRLIVNGEVQPSGENPHIDTGEGPLEDAHYEPPVVPAVALIAMQSLEFQQRLQKEAARYLQSLEDHQLLADAFRSQTGDFPPRVAFRSKKLPDWWGKKEDADLLKAAHLYGHKFFKKMKSDVSLSFVSRVNAPANAKNPNSKSRLKDSIGKKREDLPSESVLSSRLKKLMEALRDAASKQPAAMAALAESSHRKARGHQGTDVVPLKESLEKPIAVWGYPPSSSKQLSMTKILTASLAMEAAKKKDKGKGAHSKAGAPVIQARLLAGLPDCNMAGSKGKFLRSPYLPAVRAASKIVVLKSKQSSRSLRTSQMKLPRQDDMVFKVPKDEKRKALILQENQHSPKRRQHANEKQSEGGSSSRKQRYISSFSKSRAHH
ncbi:hypothetical protein KC19_7G126300 [Ceratodon purpureus]|uniref:Uncharacterized protein n=1 Tax=Ceratodon purpureus TaxID=3225 RepID=A0A8T0H7G1_CERPU|nr:hypothetical protein KC19_7G126300 [Ceratodon purpureus]